MEKKEAQRVLRIFGRKVRIRKNIVPPDFRTTEITFGRKRKERKGRKREDPGSLWEFLGRFDYDPKEKGNGKKT